MRLPDGTDWSSQLPYSSYSKLDDKHWIVIAPNGELCVVPVDMWTVTEHEDRTITIHPSILIHPHKTTEGMSPGWHGYLERGVFRTC